VNAEIVTQVFALSDERDQHAKRLLAAELAADRAGYADGRDDQAHEDDRGWATSRTRTLQAFTLAELELLRWGPGGRESFAAPRAGDYAGGAL
jgi:hypothetical protein